MPHETTRSRTIKPRLQALASADPPQRCSIPGCGRPTMLAAGSGLAAFHCKYHVQRKARHGSHWAPSIMARDLRPYLKAATAWVRENRKQMLVALTLPALQGLLDGAGPVEPAQYLRHRSASFKARVAFARLREAGGKPERLLATHLAVSAIIADDREAHRVEEYRIVQVAKAVHRLASGTHKRWDFPLPDGSTAPIEMHTYPRSSGQTLRVMGRKLDEICGAVTELGLEAVRELKRERYGLHPSHLPGWRPFWQRQRAGAA